MAYLSGYSKYKVLTLTGGASGAQIDHQLKLAVSYEAAMQGDFDDIRFTQADGVTLIDAWAEVIVTDTSATVWVEFPTTPANTVEQTYYMYYGNAGAASDWDGAETFIAFIDFEAYIADTAISGYSGWTQNGNVNVRTDYPYSGTKCLRVDGDSSADDWAIYTFPSAITENVIFEYHHKTSKSLTTDYDWMEHGVLYSGTTLIQILGYGREINGLGNDMTYGGAAGTSYYTPTVQNQYYKQQTDVLLDSDTMNLYVDDALKASSIAFANVVANITYIKFRAYDANNSGAKLWIDDIHVRKYAVNPPTYEFGAEQSVPTGNPYWYYNLLKRRN